MSTEKVETQLEEGAAPAAEQKQKRGCCPAWCRWYYWVAAFLLFVLVFMLIIAFAIIPAVAQKKFNDSVLRLDSLVITNPKPDSLVLSLDSSILNVHGPKTKVDPMDAVFFLEGPEPIRPFMEVEIPGFQTGGDEIKLSKKDTFTEVKDQEAFMAFAQKLMGEETLRTAIRGRTRAHIGAFKADVDYNEVVTMAGFNGLAGLEITDYSFAREGPLNGTNLVGKIKIPNKTVVSLEIGDIHFDIEHDGKDLGSGIITDLFLVPGDKEYTFYAAANLRNLLPVIEQAKMNPDTPTFLTIYAKKVAFNGEDIPWLAKPLGAHGVAVKMKA